MSNSNLVYILLLLVFLFGVAIGKFLDFGRPIVNEIENRFFSTEDILVNSSPDLDEDSIQEQVIVKRKRFSRRGRFPECVLEIYRKDEKLWQSESLGNHLEMIKFADLNKDRTREIILKTIDGMAVCLDIYAISNQGVKKIFRGGARDARLYDIDRDGIIEVIEYWRAHDKPFNTFHASIHRWDGERYTLWKDEIPVVIDPKHGDRLLFGKNKTVVVR